MPGSAFHGRMSQYVSFASQQPIWASAIVALPSAKTCVASRSDRPCWRTSCDASSIQNPDPVIVPAFNAQSVAIRTCSGVRVSEICRISASAVPKSAEPNAGGGAGRNWLAEVSNQGFTPGNWPPFTGCGGIALLVQNPGPTGGTAVLGLVNPSVFA